MSIGKHRTYICTSDQQKVQYYPVLYQIPLTPVDLAYRFKLIDELDASTYVDSDPYKSRITEVDSSGFIRYICGGCHHAYYVRSRFVNEDIWV